MGKFVEKRFLKPRRLDPERKEAVVALISEELQRHAEILFAYLHGSFVKEDRFRDIDVGIYLKEKRGFEFESDLSFELSKKTGFEVEVRQIQAAPLPFQMAVLRDGKLLFSRDDELRTDFIEKVSKRYPEYAHFRNLNLGIEGVRRQ